MEYYSAIRNNKYPPFALTWMELEGIFFKDFIYLFMRDREREREAETQAEGEADSMQGA